MPTSPVRRSSARLARLYAHGTPDPAEVADARRELAAARIEDAVSRILAEAPPLTDAQRQHIVVLLGGVA